MTQSINARINRLADGIDRQELAQLLTSVLTDLTALAASLNQLITDFDAHVHGGVTTGSDDSAAPTATTAAEVTLNTVA